MSLGISFESASSAIAYAEDAIPRFLRTGSVSFTRDSAALRRRIQRRMRESLPDVGPSLALARYALRMEREGHTHAQIARLWGCCEDSVVSALATWPEGKEHETREPVEQPSLFDSPCERVSA